MKHLVPKLKEIMTKHKTAGIHVSFLIRPYYITIAIQKGICRNEGLSTGDMVRDMFFVLPEDSIQHGQEPNKDFVEIGLQNILSGIPPKNPFGAFTPDIIKDDYEMLPDLREQIIKNVDAFLEMFSQSKGMTEKEFDKDMQESATKQDALLEKYKTEMNLSDEDAIALHRFFSPNRIVAGLTIDDVRLCVHMCETRRKQMNLFPGLCPPSLPNELVQHPDKVIPRSTALLKAIQEITADLEHLKPVHTN